MKQSGIYKLYWENCEYFYYGQSIDLIDRQKRHDREFRSKINGNKKNNTSFIYA